MQHYRTHALVFSAALVALFAFVSLVAKAGQDQPNVTATVAAPAETALQPTAIVRERHAAPVAHAEEENSLFGEAAARNSLLRHDLNWAFGGKQQRGWNLYVPLITQLIEADTEADAATGVFASALSRWQRTAGLQPSGVLDGDTLFRMVSTWQGARLKEKGYPTPDRLVTAPTSDFWDASRPDELRQVERETYAAYKRMVAAAAADPSLGLKVTAAGELAPEEKFLKIISSFRSREYQERLRKQSPHSGRAGLAVNSPHFTGRALDIYVGGEPVETKDANRAIQVQTPAYKWLVRNAHKFGFRPYYYEPWHWEYVGEASAGAAQQAAK